MLPAPWGFIPMHVGLATCYFFPVSVRVIRKQMVCQASSKRQPVISLLSTSRPSVTPCFGMCVPSSRPPVPNGKIFLTDMQRDFMTYNRIYAEYFNDNQPCRTTVGIDSLPTPIAIELKCIAVVE
jgi:hypothetical protein